ncbi:hypothetical protein pneo_cds_150 [Pandoravirus neocaledonia]|uniref:Uncharacterized protein n=1 Tax=Pandoravirus neocaledonia TaxID=2107708 RepID=A0A2U7UBC7_9VIRU|nr:hypothetical protein pneo_cds_150 [Pandoravirus neocaledonia]AVK75757.1 hypothetical protein pneo_cds_150 [Pandoravirus neocaledonia]
MEVTVRVRARAGGRVVLQQDFPVDGLCTGSRYFCALLRGGFCESLAVAGCTDGDHTKDDDRIAAPVDVVLPLPDTAPRDLALVMEYVAGVADRASLPLDACLLYRPTLDYIGADECLAACAAVWRDAIGVWPPQPPQCLVCAQRADSGDGGLTPAPLFDPDLVIAAYARATEDLSASASNFARPLFDRERFWTLTGSQSIRHASVECDCNEMDGYTCEDARRAWIVCTLRAYACYGDSLLAACDRALLRINDNGGNAAAVAEAVGAACLEACVHRDAALLSAATMAALKDWHRAISVAAPFTAMPYALSMCDLFTEQSARRLRVSATVDLCAADASGNDSGENSDDGKDDDGGKDDARQNENGERTGITPQEPPSAGQDNDNGNNISDDSRFGQSSDIARERLCNRRPRKRPRRNTDRDVRVTVDTKEMFKSALRNAFPRTADAVLGLVGQGAVLAGGCVVEAVQRESLRAHLPTSDMDLWVIGDDDCERRATFRRIIHTLFDALPEHRATVDGSVVTFAHSSKERSNDTVQVVFTDARCGGDVVAQFDLAHTAAYYDGRTVWASWDCAWSLVTRRTDAVCDHPVRQARIDHALLKGFEPLRACILSAVHDRGVKSTDDGGTQKKGGTRYIDAAAVMSAFVHRPIDASRYNDHCRVMGRPGAVLNDPIYLSMPPLRVASGAECAQCRGRNITGPGAPSPCRCVDAPSTTLALRLPRHRGDCRGHPGEASGMARRGALFYRRIKTAELSLKARYANALGEDVVVITSWVRGSYAAKRGDADGETDEDDDNARSDCADDNDDCECLHPDLLIVKCLSGATSAVDAMTRESPDLSVCAHRWVTGRVACHRIDQMPDMFTVLTAVELFVYPPGLDIVVDSLDQAAEMIPALGAVTAAVAE